MSDLSTNAEDYLEAILRLTKRKGYAQTKDIAAELKITPPSVSEMLKKLKNQKLVNYQKYSVVTLTPLGEKSAKRVLEGHNAIKSLLVYFGVPEEVAEEDACVMEHKLHPITLTQIKLFVAFLTSDRNSSDCIDAFGKYCRSQIHK